MNSDGQDQRGEGLGVASLAGPGQNSAGPEPAAQAVRSALRRRLLLQGTLGAPVALAVMQPVKTLAKAKKYCHYSGWHSFKIKTNTSVSPKEKCTAGRKSSYYKSKYSKVPKSSGHSGTRYYVQNSSGTVITLYKNTTFKDLFGNGSTNTIWYWLQLSSSTQGAFITAVFNAYNYGTSGYPFKHCSDIYNIWNNPTILGANVNQDQAALFLQQLDSIG